MALAGMALADVEFGIGPSVGTTFGPDAGAFGSVVERADTVVGGQRITAGDKVVMYYGAANRDPAHFARPERLDVGRAQNEHLAFGMGPHICLGQHLARVEIDAILREVFTRMHDIELAEAPEWLPSNFIAGPRRMPVRFRAA